MLSRPSIRRILARIIGPCRLLLAVVLLIWLLSQITRDQWRLISNGLDLRLLLVSILLTATALAMNFIRWRVLLRGESVAIDLASAMQYGCIGYASGFLSIGSLGGDVLKATLLSRARHGQLRQVFFATAMDRLIGLYSLTILTSIAFLGLDILSAEPRPRVLTALGWGASIAVVAGGILLYVISNGPRRIGHAFTQRQCRNQTEQNVRDRNQSQVSKDRRPGFFGALLLSLLSQALVIASVFVIAKAIHRTVAIPSIVEHFVIVPSGLLAAAIPVSPGGVGVFEASLEWMYEASTVTDTPPSGTLVGLTFNLVKIALAAVALLVYFSSQKSAGSSTRRMNSRCENQYFDT